MTHGKQYSVLFKFKNMNGEFNQVITVANGKTLEQAIQKNNGTKRGVEVISKVLLNEWSVGK
jgi:hypothetical protein